MPTISAQPSEQVRFYVDYLKGFKSKISGWADTIERNAREHGHFSRVLGADNPRYGTNFLEPFKKEAYRYHCSGHDHEEPDVPYIAVGHSLGGMTQLGLMLDDETAQTMADKYSAIFFSNVFLGDPYHDKALYRYFSQLSFVKDKPVGKTLTERVGISLKDSFKAASQYAQGQLTYLKRSEFNKLSLPQGKTIKALLSESSGLSSDSVFSEDFSEIPTHMQSLLIHDAAQDLLRKIREKGGLSDAMKDTPICFVTGADDPACNNDYVLELVEILKEAGFNVLHQEFDTGHNALKRSREAQNFFIEWCECVALRKPQHAVNVNARQNDSTRLEPLDSDLVFAA